MPKPKRGAHDMGGDRAGPIDTSEHLPTLTERRIDAMMLLLRAKPRAFWRTDENRRAIESLAPETYRSSGYYQKWAYAMRSLLVEKGILTDAEVDRRLAEVRRRYGLPGPAGKAPRRKPAGAPLPAGRQRGGPAGAKSGAKPSAGAAVRKSGPA